MSFKISRKHTWFWCGYLPATTLFVLLSLEGLVRWIGLAPELASFAGSHVADPYIPYKHRPLSVISGRVKNEYDYEHRHNSLGFRDVEHSFVKPEGVFRIVGLGDSFTEGWGAPYEETYLRRLEVALNDRPGEHPRVEIIKTGINGYFPEGEKLVLKYYGLRYDPDLIIVGFLPNDLLDTYWGLDAVRVSRLGYITSARAAELGEIGVWLYQNSHAARILLKKYVRSRLRKLPDDLWKDLYRPNGFYESSWPKIQSEYQEMAHLAQQNDAEFVVLHIPNNTPRKDFHTVPGDRMGAWCTSQDFLFVDSLPALKKAAETEQVYWKRDHHCTPAGYRVVAETLFDFLVSRDLVP